MWLMFKLGYRLGLRLWLFLNKLIVLFGFLIGNRLIIVIKWGYFNEKINFSDFVIFVNWCDDYCWFEYYLISFLFEFVLRINEIRRFECDLGNFN